MSVTNESQKQKSSSSSTHPSRNRDKSHPSKDEDRKHSTHGGNNYMNSSQRIPDRGGQKDTPQKPTTGFQKKPEKKACPNDKG